ncbi:DUF2972 domain-containing protein [Helicobacter sp.]|uniref:DUF2972 domain-containing protein n=1 Tax=Helicobacter sp. TaxID=218 RepID=UPI001997AEAA|nr:DUF2972 domain-containing protein [Helicobacter sp.]MBD5164955.1 DUF2972 domain-containing protein [Helicobacter sp.]
MDFRYKTFHDSQLINACPNIHNTLIIDMSEIIGQKAFDTMQKIAKYCDFKGISNTEKTFFEEKISKYEGILPLICHIPQCNSDIFITTKYWIPINGVIHYEIQSRYEGIKLPQEIKDITDKILENSTCEIIFVVAKGEEKRLLGLSEFAKVKQYCKSLVEWIEKQKRIEDSKALSETKLLDYLSANKPLAKKLDKILDEHLVYINKARPDIVESWKYYQEFKQL